MPLVAHNDLPTFDTLSKRGVEVVRGHPTGMVTVGLLNLMPDAALESTERQWMRLCAAVPDLHVKVIPFSVCVEDREPVIQAHIQKYYMPSKSVFADELQLLIVTGANPKTSDIVAERFWQPMMEVIQGARDKRCPVVCSCLATHAVAQHFYGVQRVRLPNKQWGVYEHELLLPEHALLQGVNGGWLGPHSHVYGMTGQQLSQVECDVLVDSNEAGFYIAASRPFPEFIFFQGHPEYDAHSLLKEFKREVHRFVVGERISFPPVPENYFDAAAMEYLDEYRHRSLEAKVGQPLPVFPEEELQPRLRSPWTVTGEQLFANLLREVGNVR